MPSLTQQHYLTSLTLTPLLLIVHTDLNTIQQLILDITYYHRSSSYIRSSYHITHRQLKTLKKLLTQQYINNVPLPYQRYQHSYLGVTSQGDVINIATRDLLTPKLSSSGYLYITIRYKQYVYKYYIHHLVAKVYLPTPTTNSAYVINHIDGNKLNNDVSNLEYITQSQNVHHAIKNNLRYYYGYHHTPKQDISYQRITLQQATTIREEYKTTNITIKQLARRYHVSKATIRKILNNRLFTSTTSTL